MRPYLYAVFCFLILPVFVFSYDLKSMNLVDDMGSAARIAALDIPYLAMFDKDGVDLAFSEAMNCGVKTIRIYASFSGDKPYSFMKSPGEYREESFKKLDYIISSAERNGIKLIICLMDNNPSYGGSEIYALWSRNSRFFSDKKSIGIFKDYVKKIVTRKNSVNKKKYTDQSSILAWDLCNDAWVNEAGGGQVLYDWAKDMSAYVKKLDNGHFVTMALKKIDYNPSGINSFDILLIPDIDFGTIKFAASSVFLPETVLKYIKSYIPMFLKNTGKPVVLLYSDRTSAEPEFATAADAFFGAGGTAIVFGYGGTGAYSLYPGAINMKKPGVSAKLKAAQYTGAKYNIPEATLNIDVLKVIPGSRDAEFKLKISGPAGIKVLTGQVFPLKKESVEYPVSGSGDVIVEGLDPDVSYNYIVRAVSVTASGFSVPGTFRTLPVEKTEAVKIKMSANIILARDGRFYDGENIFTFIGAADPLIRNESRGEIDRLMSEYSKIGLKVLRIGCSGEAESMDKLDADKGKDFFRIGPDYFNENMYKKIDYVIDSASRHGMRVVMTAAENGWAGGGIKVIAGWAGTGSDGFWDNADAKKYYQQSICKFVTRKNTVSGKMYRDDPAIFAYELCDSIDAGEDSDKNRKMNWVREMAGYFRSIDPNHMLTTGMAGIQGVHSSLDGAQGIDFSSFQVQNDAKNGDEILARIRAFVNDGHNICKKPVVLERLGCTEDAVGYGRTKLFDSALRVFYDAGGDGANVCAFAGYDGAGKREDDRFKDVEYTNVFVKYANVADKNGY